MIADIADKLARRERLSLEDGVRLFEHPSLLDVAALANREREHRHGDLTYYN
jgi:aminodeoxyfutalosine synthase